MLAKAAGQGWLPDREQNPAWGISHKPERECWIPFSLETTARRITFQIGDETGEVRGPVDMDGENLIALAVGTKLKNVRLELQ